MLAAWSQLPKGKEGGGGVNIQTFDTYIYMI